uniref:Uncharacterized protein n=1 Tax=Glossina brevipalpis TaxID=37001 RepID=A0A1A9WMV5_9MUSC
MRCYFSVVAAAAVAVVFVLFLLSVCATTDNLINKLLRYSPGHSLVVLNLKHRQNLHLGAKNRNDIVKYEAFKTSFPIIYDLKLMATKHIKAESKGNSFTEKCIRPSTS